MEEMAAMEETAARSSDTSPFRAPASDSGRGRASARERDSLVDREESDFDDNSGGRMPPPQDGQRRQDATATTAKRWRLATSTRTPLRTTLAHA